MVERGGISCGMGRLGQAVCLHRTHRAGSGSLAVFWLTLFVLAFGWMLTVCAQQAPSEQTAQAFRYRFTPNSQSKYRVNAQMSGTLPLFGGLPVEQVLLDMTLVLKVRSVRPDGNAEVLMDVEAFKAEMDGQALPLPLERLRASLRDFVIVVSPLGEVVERKGASMMPFNVPLPGIEPSHLPLLLLQLVFPRDPISVEQEWTYTRAMTSTPNDQPAQFTARWVKEEPVSGIPASVFTQKMRWNRSFQADIFDMPTTDASLAVKQIEQNVIGEAQIWFHREEGRLVKATMTAQYEQQTRLLNPSETAVAPVPARLTAKIQILREELAPRENGNKPNGK